MGTREEKKEQRKQRKEQRKEDRKQKRRDDDDDAARDQGRLLAKLCACSDDELGSYREKRLSAESAANVDRLHMAREALLAISDIFDSPAESDWSRLESAATALEPPSDDEDEDELAVTKEREPDGPSLATAKARPDEPPVEVPLSAPPPAPAAPIPPVAIPPSPTPGPVHTSTPSDRPPGAASPWAAGGSEPPGPIMAVTPAPTPQPPTAVTPPAAVRPASVPPPGMAAAPVVTEPLPPPTGKAKPRKPVRPLDRTAPGVSKTGAMAAAKGSSYLPFKGKGEKATPPKPTAAALRDMPIGLGLTVVGEVMSPLVAALPFEKDTGSDQLPQLTLEQYASLCAERNAKPGELEATLQKYGLADGKAERALDDQWKKSFDARPKQRERWLQMVREFTAWLENHR